MATTLRPCLEFTRGADVRRVALPVTLLIALGLAGGCKTGSIYQPEQVAHHAGSSATLTEIGEAVDRAGEALSWKMRPVIPGRTMGLYRRRAHVAQVMVDYDHRSFSILYVRSQHLKADDGKIHKAYNRWIRDLEERIELETGLLQ